MMGWYGGFGWVGWLMMTLLMLGFWALVIFGGMALFRSYRGSSSEEHRASAEQLLDERFARGEIDAEEYTRRRELLRSRG